MDSLRQVAKAKAGAAPELWLADPDLYAMDGLQPVDSSAYDVIRELRTDLADLLE